MLPSRASPLLTKLYALTLKEVVAPPEGAQPTHVAVKDADARYMPRLLTPAKGTAVDVIWPDDTTAQSVQAAPSHLTISYQHANLERVHERTTSLEPLAVAAVSPKASGLALWNLRMSVSPVYSSALVPA